MPQALWPAASARLGGCWMSALVASGLGTLSSLVAAQAPRFDCAPLLASTTQQPAYGPVAGETRCEGFYVRNVAAPFIELLSLTDAAPGSWGASPALNLRASRRLDTQLLIQPLRSNPLYRVDARLSRDAALAWNGASMLQATGLAPRDLGFLARAGASDPPRFVPVSMKPAASPGSATVYAVLRPSVAVSSLTWRGYRVGAELPGDGWRPLAGAPLFAWERIALPIPLPADGQGLRVDVRALDAQGRPLPLLQFAVLGLDDGAP
ncbi:hypothetical protein [Pelomonas cellulosilytica]|uniref:Uncharacterized protein n=1 Tax=Pelomonas cellulosilytica TaxID=2906762 RepID=A0ABS8XSH2_9BURK|nr:hypothetical protein [Pelomonas sp. P8]MCE4553842.1 hypothetical protein [Pelomonas sp. P8]